MLQQLSPIGPLTLTTDSESSILSLTRSDLDNTITITQTENILTLSATINATKFVGDGSQLSNLSVGQISDMPSYATTTQLNSSKSFAIAMAIALG